MAYGTRQAGCQALELLSPAFDLCDLPILIFQTARGSFCEQAGPRHPTVRRHGLLARTLRARTRRASHSESFVTPRWAPSVRDAPRAPPRVPATASPLLASWALCQAPLDGGDPAALDPARGGGTRTRRAAEQPRAAKQQPRAAAQQPRPRPWPQAVQHGDGGGGAHSRVAGQRRGLNPRFRAAGARHRAQIARHGGRSLRRARLPPAVRRGHLRHHSRQLV
mmetsp:Transcript_26571/g.62081  ORF Transcript_26571/g.62081 Transcript_26571/m.62081 type:complete len:222 (-) Transcript_26571:1010-1675(-)